MVDSIVGGEESFRAAEASECANEQGRFWDYHDLLFTNQRGEGQGNLRDQRLKAFAQVLGLDTERFNSCFDSRRMRAAVTDDIRRAQSLGISGTPTIYVNGQLVEQAGNYSVLKSIIDAQLGP